MTDAVIEGLGLINGVNVRPRKSSWSKLDNATLMRRVASELGARFVVTGAATQSSNRFGLTLRVLQTPDGRVVAQDTVAGDTNDLAALELAALERVVKHLGLAIDSDRRRQIEKILADNLAALEFYRRGLQLPERMKREDFAARIELFNRAIELDPNYLQPFLALALTYRVTSEYEQPPKLIWPEARNRAMMALRIDDTCADAHHWLAGAKLTI